MHGDALHVEQAVVLTVHVAAHCDALLSKKEIRVKGKNNGRRVSK